MHYYFDYSEADLMLLELREEQDGPAIDYRAEQISRGGDLYTEEFIEQERKFYDQLDAEMATALAADLA